MTTYDQDYYAQGKKNYRFSILFQPILALLYFWRVQVTLARLPHAYRTGSRALDVGAGRGEFLFYLRQKGWQVVGTQISRPAISAAKQHYDLTLIETNIPSAQELGQFDLITYWHVFEHLEKPEKHLAEISKLLKDEQSVLIIEVPNPDSLGARLCYRSWLGSDPENHINMVSMSALQQMIEEARLEIFQLDSFASKFTFVYLYSALCGWFSNGYLDFDYFLELLKRPADAFQSPHIGKTMLLILISPPAILGSLMLTPVGIWLNQPEILRSYIRLRENSG